jgi:hypothetical protein
MENTADDSRDSVTPDFAFRLHPTLASYQYHLTRHPQTTKKRLSSTRQLRQWVTISLRDPDPRKNRCVHRGYRCPVLVYALLEALGGMKRDCGGGEEGEVGLYTHESETTVMPIGSSRMTCVHQYPPLCHRAEIHGTSLHARPCRRRPYALER